MSAFATAIAAFTSCFVHGQNKTRRAHRELGLQLRNKTPKRRVKAKLRVLTTIDIFSRFSPALAPRLPRMNSEGARDTSGSSLPTPAPASPRAPPAYDQCRRRRRDVITSTSAYAYNRPISSDEIVRMQSLRKQAVLFAHSAPS